MVWDWDNISFGFQPFDLFAISYYEPLVGLVRPEPASQDIAERILFLGSNQTTQEGEISEYNSCRGHIAPFWLRTCYNLTLATQYEELKMAADPEGHLENRILDNAALYAFADSPDSDSDSWRKILIRIPAFTEFVGASPMDGDGSNFIYHSGLDDEEVTAQIETLPDEASREVSRISRRVQAVLYLVDREAITAGKIKVLWLDEHGVDLWDNWIEPSGLEDLTPMLQDAIRFDEIVETDGCRGDLLLI